MGGWKLEVFKMGVYISFPVVCFLVFNNPSFYEKTIMQGRRDMATAYDPEGCARLKEKLDQIKKEKMDRDLQQLKSRSN